jgi:hypothetical protein
LATSQNPLKKPRAGAAPPSLVACRMDKLGAKKNLERQNYIEHCGGFQEHKNQIICMERAYGRHAISNVIINYNNNNE